MTVGKHAPEVPLETIGPAQRKSRDQGQPWLQCAKRRASPETRTKPGSYTFFLLQRIKQSLQNLEPAGQLPATPLPKNTSLCDSMVLYGVPTPSRKKRGDLLWQAPYLCSDQTFSETVCFTRQNPSTLLGHVQNAGNQFAQKVAQMSKPSHRHVPETYFQQKGYKHRLWLWQPAPTAEAHNLLIFQSTRQGLDNTSKVQPVSSGFSSELTTCNVELANHPELDLFQPS